MKKLIICLSFIVMTSCGYGMMQTAKTVEKGKSSYSFGTVYQGNKERPFYVYSISGQFNFRHGVHDRVDFGIKQFFIGGLLADAKVNVLDPKSPFALSFSSGIGFAVDPINVDIILQVPVFVHLSYTVKDTFTPYATFGYETNWIFRKEKPENIELEEGFELSQRKGYGDGNLVINGGFEFHLGRKVFLMLEYIYRHPVVNDPGDYYSFLPNHFGGLAIRFER
ncbi:MAG TPA: hypothetical protein PLD55_15105 [bacterium]|nr:hypothetical protein [bacterium]HOB71364.1 hypothetical protein [bacterium]HOG44807.1 hypothetical protein [bacterium]HPV21860.1 hypothetical protein [bacterium]HPY15906.1 hypothetical protein [bacterium]